MIKRVALSATILGLLAGLAGASTAVAHVSRARAGTLTRAASTAGPDEVLRWNSELQQVLVAPGAQPASIHPTRTLAITQVAVYDAVDGVLRGRTPLLVRLRGPRHASAAAAVASAARTAIDALLPSQQPAVDAFFEARLSQLGLGPRVDEGIRFGQAVADAVVAARANDGASAPPPVFTPGTGPGEYQLTPPAFQPAAFTQTAHVRPFVLAAADQFRPAPPPALTSATYAADFAEVHALGSLTSTARTADQTAIGRFWGAAPIWIVWNQIAGQLAAGSGDDLRQNARVFAVLNVALADSAVAMYDAKYAYHRWRPITAIAATDQGNQQTVTDPTWVPLANTANDPSYPGAHATFSQAAATVLDRLFGTDMASFSLSNSTVGITRSFTSISQAAAEASASRIFAGQHFRYDEDAGQTLGRRVAEFVLEHGSLARGHHHR